MCHVKEVQILSSKEARSRRKPWVSYIKTFGFVVYVLVL